MRKQQKLLAGEYKALLLKEVISTGRIKVGKITGRLEGSGKRNYWKNTEAELQGEQKTLLPGL